MRRCLTLLALFAVGAVRAADLPKPNTLTPEEFADGWVQLFDGETLFGWKTDGDVKMKDSVLTIGGSKPSSAITTAEFGYCRVAFEFRPVRASATDREGAKALFADHQSWRFNDWVQVRDPASVGPDGWISSEWEILPDPNGVGPSHLMRTKFGPGLSIPGPMISNLTGNQGPFGLRVESGHTLTVRSIKLKPLGLTSIFNGKDLTGWKQFTGNEKQAKSKFSVTPEGWLNVTNGPGDLQTEKQWADFVFQGECISNGKHLNSGVFFRCLPGQYQQGYEFQIQNGYKENDRTKPVDFGTGAIYRRVPVRKVVPNDNEWFTMTLITHGNHIRTWVNGYPTVDWTDDRKENDNARNGSKLGAGPISLQGHDPTTNLSFRNLKVAELK
jgi:hypothetical protein